MISMGGEKQRGGSLTQAGGRSGNTGKVSHSEALPGWVVSTSFTQSPETHIRGDCCLGTDYGHRTKELIQDLGDTQSSHFPVMLASFLYKSYAPAYIWASHSPSFLCIRIAHMFGFYPRLIESKSLGE